MALHLKLIDGGSIVLANLLFLYVHDESPLDQHELTCIVSNTTTDVHLASTTPDIPWHFEANDHDTYIVVKSPSTIGGPCLDQACVRALAAGAGHGIDSRTPIHCQYYW